MSKPTIFILLSIMFSTIFMMTNSFRICHCPLIKDGPPVCGSDGITYGNQGELDCYNICEKNNVTVKAHKPCPCLCPNTLEYFPVCASDGKDYPNKGAVRCHNKCNNRKIRILKYGSCEDSGSLIPNN